MSQVFASNGKELASFLPVNRGFGGLYVVSGAGLDVDKAQCVVVSANQVNFATAVGRTKLRAIIVYPRFRR